MRAYVYQIVTHLSAKLTDRWCFSYQDNSIAFFASFEARILSGFTLGLSVVCDVLIVVGLSYYLHPKRTGVKR